MPTNILIIEDDDFLRGLIGKKLLSEGIGFSVAVNGKDGIKKAKATKPNLILLDLLLPDIDGFGVLSEVKKEPSLSSVPVIILSNLSSKEDIDKGLKLGAVDFLVKSQSNLDTIVNAVKVVLDKNKSQ